MDRETRDNLLSDYVRYDHARMHGGDVELGMDVMQAKKASLNAVQAYYESLPVVEMSRCPFTRDPVVGAFDPWGFDGLWWSKQFRGSAPKPGGGNLRLVMGAVELGEEDPEKPTEGEVLLGPGAPFVVPSVLKLPGMQAVISTLEMSKGRKAHLTCYFSLEAPRPIDLYQPWLSESMSFQMDGKSGWTIKTDPWDFDLRPWIAEGRLRWIEPGDTEMRLADPEPSKCPYLDHEGVQKRQILSKAGLRLVQLPDGEEIDPFTS